LNYWDETLKEDFMKNDTQMVNMLKKPASLINSDNLDEETLAEQEPSESYYKKALK
jgi:hypothetical protein